MAASDDPRTVELSRDDATDRGTDPATAVSVLDDETAVKLFLAITGLTSVPAVADACDLPLSTAYRKVHTVERAGLLRTASSSDADETSREGDGRTTRYERAVDGVTVTLRDDLRVAYIREDDD